MTDWEWLTLFVLSTHFDIKCQPLFQYQVLCEEHIWFQNINFDLFDTKGNIL